MAASSVPPSDTAKKSTSKKALSNMVKSPTATKKAAKAPAKAPATPGSKKSAATTSSPSASKKSTAAESTSTSASKTNKTLPSPATKQTKLNFDAVKALSCSTDKKRKDPPSSNGEKPPVPQKFAKNKSTDASTARKEAGAMPKPAPADLHNAVSLVSTVDPSRPALVFSASQSPQSATSTAAAAASQQSLPRITKDLTLFQLKAEARARQLFDTKTLPKTKAGLLNYLVDGSIYVAETEQYKAYQALLQRLGEEERSLRAQSLAKLQAEEQKRLERQEKKAAQEKATVQARRATEEARQVAQHKHSFPRVHPHPLAYTRELLLNGQPRNPCYCDFCENDYFNGTRVISFGLGCGRRRALYTCEQCDWDICEICFQKKNMTLQDREAYEEHERIKREERNRAEELRQQKEEEEEERRWNAEKQFKVVTRKPSQKNKDLEDKGHNYVVWCSDGYGNDGWHSYNPPPTQHFDSSWKTAKEANERARYLFFWKNPWGLDPQEVSDDNGDPKPTTREGLETYTVEPADSSCWAVGVVPSAAFHHLPKSSTERHNFDDEQDCQHDFPTRHAHSSSYNVF